MKVTKISIKNLLGIKELELGNESIELKGTNGTGKTSVLDSIRYALTNDIERDYIIRQGQSEGEILIETDTGLSINRKKRSEQSDYKNIRENGNLINKPESFLQGIFTELQLDPIEFTKMSRQEQNRKVLDLIEFEWDLNWITEQFGEIPSGVSYEQNILKVLSDIQKKDGVYFLAREEVNRDIRNKKAFIADISKDIPEGYDFEKWNTFDSSSKHQALAVIKEENSKIQRAKAFKDAYDNKKRGYEAEKEIAISNEKQAIADEKETLKSGIERLKAEIISKEEKLLTLADKLNDKTKVVEAKYNENITKLDADVGIAGKYAEQELADTNELQQEIELSDAMKKHLNEYKRMLDMQAENVTLSEESTELTRKIELARELPATILKTAKLPIEGLTVKDGIPLINGLPISNLSEGEKLQLCVDIAITKPNNLSIILLDGTEKLSDENRLKLYESCKAKGLQFIATRTTNNNELEVVEL